MTVNDLLRERLLAKLNLPENSVGSLSDLLYTYLLDPDSGGGGGGGGGDSILMPNPAPTIVAPPDPTVIEAYGVKLAIVPLGMISVAGDTPAEIQYSTDGARDGDILIFTVMQDPTSPPIDLLSEMAPGMVVLPRPTSGTAQTMVILSYIGSNDLWYPIYHSTVKSVDTGEGVPEGVSSDENNALSNGTDGKAWLSASSFEDFVTNTGLSTLLKYATLAFVLEANEDETDLPSDFPTGPLYPGGPAPLVFRKKAE